MELGRIAVRALVAYIYLLLVTRLSGKRVVSQATPFDFVVSLILGDLIDDAVWAEVSMAKFAVGCGTIVALDGIIKFGAFHSQRFYRLVNGTPTAVLRDGREDRRELRSEQLNEADLAHLLRLDGIEDWKQVHLALVERDHEASALRKPAYEPLQKRDKEAVRR